MATIHFYAMDLSGPCRTVEIVAKILGVNLNKKPLDLMKGEHLTPEYLKLNPFHKVPFVVDGDLKLSESRAIITYLVNKYSSGDSPLYPKDPVKRALVDQGLNIDLGLIYPSIYKAISPIFRRQAKELNPDDVKAMKDTFQLLDTYLENKRFIAGDALTLADISLSSTMTMTELMDFGIEEFKSISRYYNDLKTNVPHYDTIHGPAIQAGKEFFKKLQE